MIGGSCFAFEASLHSLRLKNSAAINNHYDVSTASCLWSTSSNESNAATLAIPFDETLPSAKLELDLHSPALNAIAQGLFVRAQNLPNMPLRIFEEDENIIEPWEVTLSAGKVAQQTVEEWQEQEQLTLEENEEEMQVVGGRVVAVLTRLEELEEELLKRCNKMSKEVVFDFGVTQEELNVMRTISEDETAKRLRDAAAVIDAICLFDEQLRYNRAKSLLAIFLSEIEGPGLKRNGVILPCMEVNFLSEEELELLGVSSDVNESSESNVINVEKCVETTEGIVEKETPLSSSLHHVVIDAIEEALKLRAQNVTTSPLRLLDSNMEWFEVQYSVIKFAERFLEKRIKEKRIDPNLTEEEQQTIGGRIVGILMRLDDLEWEWNHRVETSIFNESTSPDMIPQDQWKSILGLHPGNVEQSCTKTLDKALLEDRDFARKRAEIMLALFLLNIEGPAMKASENNAPDGSKVDFVRDENLIHLMQPKVKQ